MIVLLGDERDEKHKCEMIVTIILTLAGFVNSAGID